MNNSSDLLLESKDLPPSTDSSNHTENKDDQLVNSVEQAQDHTKVNVTQEIIRSENKNQNIKNIQENTGLPGNTLESLKKNKKKQIPEPIVQDEFEKIDESKALPESVIQSPDTSIVTTEITKEKIENQSDQYGEIKKKILPLPVKIIIIRFKYNNNDFTEEGFRKLKDFANVLIMHPDTKILIAGHTDSDGYQKYNVKLSEFRANIVKSFLLGKGAKSNQIEIKGFGSIDPIESNDTAWGRTMNRRVEIEIVK